MELNLHKCDRCLKEIHGDCMETLMRKVDLSYQEKDFELCKTCWKDFKKVFMERL